VSELPWKWTAETFVSYTYENYQNINTISNPFKRRRDHSIRGTIRLTHPLADHLTFFLDYDYNREISNVDPYEYEQTLVSSGIIWAL
jgi:hypothetical protein